MGCAVCNSDDFLFLFERNQFHIEKCTGCGLVQVGNIPESEAVYQTYDKKWFETYYTGLENNARKQRYVYLNFHNKLEQIERRIGRRGRLLDVGCSFGFFLDAARQRGWAVDGVDVSAHVVDYASSRWGLPVKNVSIAEAEYSEQCFDVITMWYVIEHLPNPIQSLQNMRHILKDDGMIVVSSPNVESHLAKIQAKKWRNWLPPEHLLYFSPRTLRSLFARVELEVFDEETAVPYEMYLRRLKLYTLIDRMKVSDNLVYYIRKTRSAEKVGLRCVGDNAGRGQMELD